MKRALRRQLLQRIVCRLIGHHPEVRFNFKAAGPFKGEWYCRRCFMVDPL